jgi:hypothetical protein
MSETEFVTLLRQGKIVTLSLEEWQCFSGLFHVLEIHETGFAGQLVLLRGPTGLVAKEESKSGEYVVRPLDDQKKAEEFIQDRMSTYERMWDGCGCKIDYYR